MTWLYQKQQFHLSYENFLSKFQSKYKATIYKDSVKGFFYSLKFLRNVSCVCLQSAVEWNFDTESAIFLKP